MGGIIYPIKFAVNPVDPNGLAISSPGGAGRLFRSTDQGRTWFVAGGDAGAGTTPFDGTSAPAIAFGAPDPANPNQLNNFLYAGTGGGHIYVTFKGGGNSWTDISSGLDGSTVQQIVPDPVRGTRDAFAVTSGGVFYMADSSSPTATWVNLTGNLFSISKPIFNDPNPGPKSPDASTLEGLTSIAPDWRYAIPVDPANPSRGTYPILYAGGYGGVFRSLDDGKTWQIYPQGTAYTYTDPTTGLPATINLPDGGYLPAVNVTQLTLSFGNIDPATGQPLEQTGGLNLLTAATYGRGTWVIRLGTPANDPAIATLAKYQVVKQSGPQVIGVDVVSQPAGGTGSLRVMFNAPVLARSFTPGQIQIKDAAGNPLTITAVFPLGNSTAPAAFPAVPGTPSDYHNLFQVNFAGAPAGIKGFGQVVIGPNIADYAGFFMDQNNNGVNGETAADPNNGGAAADAYRGYLYLDSAGTGVSGSLHINMPVTTTAGAPTKVIVSDLDPGTGLPNPNYTGTISLTATINGQQFVLTNAPVVGLLNLSEVGTTVTATTDGPPAFAPGQKVTIAGVTTAGYNGTFVITSVGPTGFTYTNPISGLPADALGGGTATGPLVPVAALSGTPTPVPTGPLPATYTFTPADQGTHVFTIFFLPASSPPNQTLLSVADVTGRPPNGAQAFITVNPGRATQFIVSGLPDPVTAGTGNNFTVTAADPYGNTDPTYTGTATLTTSDPQGTLVPTPYTFTSGTGTGFDNGVHVFRATLRTAGPTRTGGPETVTVTDATNPRLTLTGSQTVTVLPAAAASVTVTGFPAPVVAGTAGTFTVTLNDAFGNIATGYTGTMTFTSDDPFPATFTPPSYTFTGRGAGKDNGVHTFTNGATLFTAGTRSITATDAANSLAGTLTPVTIVPAATAKLLVAGFPNPVVAGAAGTFTVTATDQFGNTTPAYTGTVAFTTTNPLFTFSPTTATFAAGDNGVKTLTNGAVLRKAGTGWSITATDTATATLTGSQTGIVVIPAAAATIAVTGFPTSVVAGTAGSFTLTLTDSFGNIATGYRGTIKFSSTDPLATFAPTTYPFVAADAGIKTFTNGATLRKAGTWSITATDSVNASLTGSETGIVVTPAATSKFAVGGFPNPVVAGTAGTFTVTAQDQFGNTTPAYTGTTTFSTTDPLGTFSPTSASFAAGDAGTKTFVNGATLRKAGTWSITAIDSASPSLTGSQTGIVVNPAAASSLAVSGFPTPVVAGTAGSFTVTLTDPFGNVATGYLGTVAFTTTDPLGTFSPTSASFTAGDAGTKTFVNGATLRKAGTWSITATDSANPSLTGSQTGIVVNPAAASSLTVSGFPTAVVAGTASSFTVTLTDPFGNIATGYRGTVNFSTTDPLGTFSPASASFTAGDKGVKTFANGATLRKAGTWSITAADAASPSLTGSQTGIVVNPAAASSLAVSGFPTPVVAGTVGSFTVTLTDPFGNVATGYLGTVAFTTTDPLGTFSPTSASFAAADKGVKTFANGATLRKAGTWSITAADAANSLTGSQTGIVVTPAAASSLTVSGFPTPVVAGTAGSFTVTLTDPFGNVATGYRGTVVLSTTDPLGTLTPATYPFVAADAGTKTFTNGAILRKAGTWSVTATDTVTAALTGSETGIVVSPAAVSQFVVGGVPSPVTAGTANGFTVTATDPFGNTTPTYTGTVAFTTTDPLGTFSPTSASFAAADKGVKTFANGATLRKAGTWSITAADAANSLTGSQTGIVVTPAAASSLAVSGFPTAVVAGTAGSFTVTLTDPFGNVATGYRGTVALSTTDPLGTLTPATYPFVAADAGTKTFTNGAILRKAGTWSITATDTVTTALTGSETGIVVSPAAVSQFVVGGFPAAVVAGTPGTFTVTARDQFGNTTVGYTGTVALSSTDPQAAFSPATYPFVAADAGTKTFSGTLKTAGSQSITAADATLGATGSQTGIQVTPAPTVGFMLSGVPATVAIGTSNQLTVTAVDASGNTTPGYTGTVAVASSDPLAGLPPAAKLTNGVATFSVILNTPGFQSLRAADTAVPTLAAVNSLTTTVVAQAVIPPPTHYAAGSGAGGSPVVFVYDAAGNTIFGFSPFGPGYTNGIRVAVGDVNGDGVDDYIVGTGPGGPSNVVVVDGQTRQPIMTYQPFESTFTGGVFVTAGRISPTGPADIVITPDQGGGPRVVVLEGGDFKKVSDFLGIDDPNFRGGARTAVGDVTGDGYGDIAVAAGFGGGPRVSVFDGKALLAGRLTHPFNDFFVFGGSDARSLRDGAFIALGDVNGDGFADIIAGGGPGGGPRVRIVSGRDLLVKPADQAGVIADFFAGSANSRGGIRVAAKNLTGGKNADVVTGDGELEGSTVTAYKGSSLTVGGTDKISTFDPFPGFLGGVYVG